MTTSYDRGGVTGVVGVGEGTSTTLYFFVKEVDLWSTKTLVFFSEDFLILGNLPAFDKFFFFSVNFYELRYFVLSLVIKLQIFYRM